MREHCGLVVGVNKGDGGVKALLAVDAVVHSADLETLLRAAKKTGLSSAVTRASLSNDGGLHEHTASSVVTLRECDGVLVVLAKVEVSREPGFNAGILANNLNKAASGLASGVVKPAAAVHHMVFLQDAKSRAHGRSVREDDHSPALVRRALLHCLFEPVDLVRINVDFMRSVLGVTEFDRGEAD